MTEEKNVIIRFQPIVKNFCKKEIEIEYSIYPINLRKTPVRIKTARIATKHSSFRLPTSHLNEVAYV